MMTTSDRSEVKAYLLRLLQNAKGDSYERAQHAFSGMNDEQLDQMHGQSGKTRREILNGYRDGREKWQAAYDLANSIEV